MLNQDLEVSAAVSADGFATLRAKLAAWRFPGPVFWGAALLCLLAVLSLLPLAVALWSPPLSVWTQVAADLPRLAVNSLGLAGGVVCGSGILGTGLAWLTACCKFPGRRFFNWALLLPLAMPTYVLGFVLVGWLDAGGPVRGAWFALWGKEAGFPAADSVGWLILSLSFSLYPYVYLPARHAFQNQAGRAMDAARSLGAGPLRAFSFAALPVSLPWLGVGLCVVAMEAMSDIGTASLFHYQTLATAIYQAWRGAASLAVAGQWAGYLLLLACAVLVFEQRVRLRQGLCPQPAYGGGLPPVRALNSAPNFAALVCVVLALAVTFCLPLGQLLAWGLQAWVQELYGGLVGPALHALSIALGGAAWAVVAALVLGLAKRHHPRAGLLLVRLASWIRALPGAVLALGLLASLAVLGGRLAAFAKSQFDWDWPALPGGDLGLLLLAYLVGCMTLGFGPVDAALRRIAPPWVDAAHGLGIRGLALWRQVYWPLLRGGLLGAFLLAFARIAQDLPVVLLLRPPDWDTLAVRVFDLARAGQWQQAALPGLALVVLGLPQIFVLARGAGDNRYGRA